MTSYVPTIYLVRHASPDWSRTDLPYHLPPGPPLTEQGVDEAVQLGQFLREAGVRQLYTSPLERATHTARIVATITGAPLQPEADLAEWRPGEDDAAIRARFWPIWQQASALSHQAGPVALITHGGPIGLLLGELGLAKDVLAQHRSRFDRSNPLPPAGAWKATRATDSSWGLSLSFVPDHTRKAGLAYL